MNAPTPDTTEIRELAALFAAAARQLQGYLGTPEGLTDGHYDTLTFAVLSLNNVADRLQVMRLQLATAQGAAAAGALAQATPELKQALERRRAITHDLTVVQALVCFGVAIALRDAGGIVSGGDSLYKALHADGDAKAAGA